MSQKGALDAVLDWLKKKISRRDAAVFGLSFLIALAVHFYAFTNKLLNHDDLSELFGGGSLLASGRWLLDPLIRLTGRVSMPMLYGLVGSAFLALTVLTVIRVLGIRRLLTAAAAALCMAAHPTVVCTWAYMFTAPAYFMAMFLAVLGAALLRRSGWRQLVPGAALIAMSMGCYQAYLTLSAALMVIAVLLDVLDGTYEGRWKPLLLDCLKYLAGLLLGLALYLAVLKLCLLITGTELLSYAGIDGMTGVTFSTLLQRAGLAYKRFYDFNNSTAFTAINRWFPLLLKLGQALFFLSVLGLAVERRLWRTPVTLAVLLAFLALTPLAVGLIYVMAGESAIHWLTRYATVLLWVFPAAVGERLILPEKGTAARAAAGILAALLLALTGLTGYESALVTNKAYLEMELNRQAANNYLTRLFTKIEQLPGYTPDAKVALIGRAKLVTTVPDEDLTGIFPAEGLVNMYSRARLFSLAHGFAYQWVSPEETEQLAATAEFAAMPVYPAQGSIRAIDGIITVKLSETQE